MGLVTEKGQPSVAIEFHADDYGMFPIQSQRILDCCAGALNGVSIMPNSEYLEQSMAGLSALEKDLTVAVHLNLIEGRSLCPPDQVPLLTREDGVFRCGFGSLLLHSFLPGRKEWKAQLKREYRAQIARVASLLPPGTALRLDGHAHYHMVPVAFDALMEVLQEENRPVSYIRIPREAWKLYLSHWRQLRGIAPVNLLKVGILNLLAWRNCRKYGGQLAAMEKKLFLGVFLSGRMCLENVKTLLPDALALAKEKGWGVEILSHPGGIREPEDIAKLTNRADIAFLTSPNRDLEGDMLKRIHA